MSDAPWGLIRRLEAREDQLEAEIKALKEENERLRKQVASLQDDSAKLSALECAGVDNWEWYGEAMRAYREEGDS